MSCRKCGASKTHLYLTDDDALACMKCGERDYKGAAEYIIGRTEKIAMTNNIKPETKERIETLLREGNGIRGVSRLTGVSSNTVSSTFKALPGSEELKCKCGLLLTHRGRCTARRESTKEILKIHADAPKTPPAMVRFQPGEAQEIPITIRLTIDVSFRVNACPS